MFRKIGATVYFALIVLAFFGFSKKSYAADALPPGYLVGDDTGLKVGTDGVYFIRHDDITPGLTFERKITISNYSNKEGTFEINFVMNPEDDKHRPTLTGEVNLLEAVSVTLTYQGKKIYTGPIDGSGTPVANKKGQPLALGALETGEVRTMQAEFKVSDQYPASAWKKVNAVDFYWLFFAERTNQQTSTTESEETTDTTTTETENSTGDSTSEDSSDTQPTDDSENRPQTGEPGSGVTGKEIYKYLPQTGEDWRNTLFGASVGILLICVVLIIVKKRADLKKK